ncbi:MAG TPA: transporter, partial [Burkholderiales bacterium]|nr:transporter [Burkholderiales bacterium]
MESRRIRQAAAAGFLLLAALASGALAQDLEPRSYSNAPIGLNFLIGGFLYTRGDVAVDASVEVTDARLQTRSAVLAYARSLDVWGRSAKFDVILPYTALDGQALVAGAPVKREVSGFGDPRFRFSINFYGAPALPPEKFAEYHQDLIIGASVQVTAPWGQYDPDKLVNLGTNRWSVKPELGASKAWGTWIVELSAAGMFFTDNDDFFGGNKRAQDPIYSAQAHIVHLLRSGI